MSILIKGMEMPFAGSIKTIVIYPDGTVRARRQDPLPYTAITVPPHGRLGDLDKLEHMFADIDNAPYSGFDGSEPFYSAEDAAQIIRLSLTVIPAEEGE